MATAASTVCARIGSPAAAPFGMRIAHVVAPCGWGPSSGGAPLRALSRAQALHTGQCEILASSQT
eukprot:3141954-Lingulodinium_polyedra.AAC.1